MNYASGYLTRQNGSIDKWHHFFSRDLGVDFVPLPFQEHLLGLFDLEQFSSWSESQKETFYFLFFQFHCEALILFEQCLITSYRMFKLRIPSTTERQAFHYFAKEEFYHTRGFRRYLLRETKYDFPKKSLLLFKEHTLKNIFVFLLRREPLSIIIPGAKSETYSLYYSKFLNQVFKEKSNTYLTLFKMHAEDEASHVQFDYHFINSMMSQRGFFGQIHFVIYSLAMIFFIQFIVICGFWNILKDVAPEASWVRRLRYLKLVFAWLLWEFIPYAQTRKNLQQTYRNQSHFMYRIFSLGAR